jgi:hypothetical protein
MGTIVVFIRATAALSANSHEVMPLQASLTEESFSIMQSEAEHFSRSAKKADSDWLLRQSAESHSVAVVEAERTGS